MPPFFLETGAADVSNGSVGQWVWGRLLRSPVWRCPDWRTIGLAMVLSDTVRIRQDEADDVTAGIPATPLGC